MKALKEKAQPLHAFWGNRIVDEDEMMLKQSDAIEVFKGYFKEEIEKAEKERSKSTEGGTNWLLISQEIDTLKRLLKAIKE